MLSERTLYVVEFLERDKAEISVFTCYHLLSTEQQEDVMMSFSQRHLINSKFGTMLKQMMREILWQVLRSNFVIISSNRSKTTIPMTLLLHIASRR